jgi:beta-xylosidase
MTGGRIGAVVLLVLVVSGWCIGADAETGSWGDQGDGTYKNPILNGDYPDVDIEQVGDTYYMITSTNHYAPGMTVLESKDIVNWRIVGHVFDKLTWERRYNFDEMSGYRFGVWAGDLAYHGGRWYCYFIDTQSGLYVSSAKEIAGPWSEPVCMLKKVRWTDPAAFWDEEEGQAYLICNFGPDPVKKVNEARIFKMSADGMKLLDEGKAVYYGQGAEAAKIYKVGGYYYVFMAEWIEGDRKQLVLRGKSIYGPFERKIVMEKAKGESRSVCQGALVRARDGSWWFTHQLVQFRQQMQGRFAGMTTGSSFEGRSQWLVPVRWVDGWPVLGGDPDGNGIGNTVKEWKKPIGGFAIDAPQTDDEFGSSKLGGQWEWNHNPRDDRWSLGEREGWLRLKANVPVGGGGFWNASNTVSQRLMGKGRGVAVAKLDVSGMKPGQQAGFCRHSGQYVLLGISVDDEGAKRLVFNNNGKVKVGGVIASDVIYYRTTNDGNRAYYEYSLDGKTYKRFGAEFELKFGRWRGDRLGFYCWNNKKAEGHIDIDYFRYDYDGPKAGSED